MDIRERFFAHRVLGTGTAPQRSSHSNKTDRVEEVFGQSSQTHGMTFGVSSAGPGVRFRAPDGFVPT